jgi:hypothetical protein
MEFQNDRQGRAGRQDSLRFAQKWGHNKIQ